MELDTLMLPTGVQTAAVNRRPSEHASLALKVVITNELMAANINSISVHKSVQKVANNFPIHQPKTLLQPFIKQGLNIKPLSKYFMRSGEEIIVCSIYVG
jgi:hypothetical protein